MESRGIGSILTGSRLKPKKFHVQLDDPTLAKGGVGLRLGASFREDVLVIEPFPSGPDDPTVRPTEASD